MDTQSQSNKHIVGNLAIFTFLVITLGWIGKYCSFHINRYWVIPAEKEKNGGHTKMICSDILAMYCIIKCILA